MNDTLYIINFESGGYLLSGSDGIDHGVAETIAEAIESAKEFVKCGEYKSYCLDC